MTRDRVWISEKKKLFLVDITTGSILHTINGVASGFWWGVHTVNINHDLFYISNDNSIIRLSNDRRATTVFKETEPSVQLRSLYCSPSTGDLLIGMHKLDKYQETGIVAKLKTGQLTMTIPDDKRHNIMFTDPNYITENNNGDIVVSDYCRGVVVTDHEGKYRFSYTETPFGSRLLPRGICTDALSHILVCDWYTETVLILDERGDFLLYIPTELSLGALGKPCSISYDWSTHLLWIGSLKNTVSMYRHINRHLYLTGNFNCVIRNVFLNMFNLIAANDSYLINM